MRTEATQRYKIAQVIAPEHETILSEAVHRRLGPENVATRHFACVSYLKALH
jgi:hypothetical protein